MEHSEHKAAGAGAYYAVFAALIVGTIITVAAALVNLGRPGNISLGLAIASVKASLVALFFMHLKYEARWIWSVALFPVALFLIFIFALMPDVAFGETKPKPYVEPKATHGSGH
jgi:cytochrome c oxidase subunit 4